MSKTMLLRGPITLISFKTYKVYKVQKDTLLHTNMLILYKKKVLWWTSDRLFLFTSRRRYNCKGVHCPSMFLLSFFFFFWQGIILSCVQVVSWNNARGLLFPNLAFCNSNYIIYHCFRNLICTGATLNNLSFKIWFALQAFEPTTKGFTF